MRIILTLALACSATAAHAQRPYTPRLACAQVQALVQSRGAVVLSTGPTTFDRFVAEGRFCASNEMTEPAYERSADLRRCFVGSRCVPYERPFD